MGNLAVKEMKGSDGMSCEHNVGNQPEFVMTNMASLRTLRRNLNWTQRFIGKSSGISLSNMSKYEAGTRKPNKETYNKLAKVFDWEEWE